MSALSRFLIEVLGQQGARSLAKAADQSLKLKNVLVPRTILAWVNVASEISFEGNIPEVNGYVKFSKSEASGTIEVDGEMFKFERVAPLAFAAVISVALDVDTEKFDSSLRDSDIIRLGKSIDLLAKAKLVKAELAKGWPKSDAENEENRQAHAIFSDIAEELGREVPVKEPDDNKFIGSHLSIESYRDGQGKWRCRGCQEVLWPTDRTPVSDNGYLYNFDWRRNPGDCKCNPERQRALLEERTKPAMDKGIRGFDTERVIDDADRNSAIEQLNGEFKVGSVNTRPAEPEVANPYERKFGEKQTQPVEKAGLKEARPVKGQSAPALEPNTQVPAVAPVKQTKIKPPPGSEQHAQAKVKQGVSIGITKSETNRSCQVCGVKQFSNERFVGCYCLSDMAKSTKTVKQNNGYSITFRPDTDPELILTIVEALKGR